MNSQDSLFCQNSTPSPDDEALLALFYFYARGLDHSALSLCVQHFKPLTKIFESTASDLKEFFSSHSHIGGYIASTVVADPQHREHARRYAQKQISILTSQDIGTLAIKTDKGFYHGYLSLHYRAYFLPCPDLGVNVYTPLLRLAPWSLGSPRWRQKIPFAAGILDRPLTWSVVPLFDTPWLESVLLSPPVHDMP